MLYSEEKLENFLNHLEYLEKYKDEAEKDLAKIENLDSWQPTPYEKYVLPALRLANYENSKDITLLNTADLHIHTHVSDGDQLRRVLAAATYQKLDAIAITDHNNIEGSIEARREVHRRRLKVAVVPGTEISSKDGHIGGLFLTKNIPKKLSAKETVDLIHDAGGIAVAHHPYTPPIIDKIFKIKLGCGDLIKEVPFDAIECTNAVPGYGSHYNMAAHEAMKKNHIHVAITGSSDAHTAAFVGKGKTYYSGNYGVDSLYAMLKLGLTEGCEGYWTFSEKMLYRMRFIKSLIRNVLKKFPSIN
jgi:predicted metal-dependent phosphoesterase TrpH